MASAKCVKQWISCLLRLIKARDCRRTRPSGEESPEIVCAKYAAVANEWMPGYSASLQGSFDGMELTVLWMKCEIVYGFAIVTE